MRSTTGYVQGGGLGEPSGALSCREDDGNRVANEMLWLRAGPTKKFGLEGLTELTAATAESLGRSQRRSYS